MLRLAKREWAGLLASGLAASDKEPNASEDLLRRLDDGELTSVTQRAADTRARLRRADGLVDRVRLC